jgi:hypothetical protein
MSGTKQKTVKDLKALAKQRGLAGYSRLRKAELIQLLSPPRNIMDDIVPEIGTPTLIPQAAKRPVRPLRSMAGDAAKKARQKIIEFSNWIMNHIPKPKDVNPTLKALKEKIMSLYPSKPKAAAVEKERAAKGWFKTYEILGLPKHDAETFLEKVKPNVLELFRKSVSESSIKTKIFLFCEMEKTNITTGNTIVETIPFPSDMEMILESTDTSEVYNTMSGKILERKAALNARGSNWIFRSVVRMDISIDKFQPWGGSSWIDLPAWVKATKSVVNPQNKEDNECFKWAITASLYPIKKNSNRVSNYEENAKNFCWDGVNFPATRKDIEVFEKANPDVAVNVLALVGRVRYAWYLSKKKITNNCKIRTVNLLLVQAQGEGDEVKTHYTSIKSLSKLLSSQIDKHNGAKHFCLNCINAFRTQDALKKHEKFCLAHKGVAIDFPDKDEKIKFKTENYCRKMRVPFVIYADFECFTKSIQGCQPKPTESYTKKYQKHEPSGFGYCIVSALGDYKYIEHTKQSEDEDIGQLFVANIEEEVKSLYKKHKFSKAMKLSEDEELSFQQSEECHICEEKFVKVLWDEDKCGICGSEWCNGVHTSKDIERLEKCPVCDEKISTLYEHCKMPEECEECKGCKECKIPKGCEACDGCEECEIPKKCQKCPGCKECKRAENCKKVLGDIKVRDHCHLTGDYRGAAHRSCNLNFKIPKFYPVFFHNLSGYDAHLFVKNLGATEGKINCIPNNEEKYISFSKELVVDTFTNKEGKEVKVKRSIRFLDSFKFMGSPLESLVKNLPQEGFKHLGKHFQGEQLELLQRKGVFPYDYFNDLSVLEETCLPPKEKFWSTLTEQGISDEDYTHAQKVWKAFDMKTFREYHDLYMKVDVLQLADVFEAFRDMSLKNYQLDPAWYYTAPGLSWDAMLKTTKLEFDPITDSDMLLFFERAIRGGVSMISNRYAKANNKYMGVIDKHGLKSFIQYLDANNLYGWAMSQMLPVSDFKWMDDQQLESWKNYPCFLEVDLEYPEDLHDLHNEYPFCPERKMVNKVEKLIPNLQSKKNYVIHYAALKQCLKHGLKLTKIHRGITFKESDKLKTYIDKNTKLRAAAQNDFEKDFFKLMNNSVFGKTMENIRNRVDIKLVSSEEASRKLTAKSNYESRTIFDENLIAVHMKVTKLKFDKPVYLGAAILDISKTLMYDFHYEYIKPKYGDKAKLLFTDTDSLMYHIETDDFYKDISEDIEDRFDTSNYPDKHPSGIPTGKNKKVIGMFKDEAGGMQITEFVGLRAKLYSYKLDGEEKKKCKGINKATTKNHITFEDYKTTLFSKNPQYRTMNALRSHKHVIYAETINKIALSADDDKRIILEDGISTKPYGYQGENLLE